MLTRLLKCVELFCCREFAHPGANSLSHIKAILLVGMGLSMKLGRLKECSHIIGT